MNISGIRPYAGIYTGQVHNIRPVESTQEVSTDLATQAAGGNQVEEKAVDNAPKREQSFGAYDYAQQYNPNEKFEMKGANSDLRTLDVENAINAMQKDSILQQYQYFVGPGQSSPEARSDVHPTQNFNV